MLAEEVPHRKIVVVGNSGCGKTALITRWVSGTFTAAMKPTIGSNHERKRVILPDASQIDLCVWDTAGQEQFQSLVPLYARSSALAVVVAAIDDPDSFAALPNWAAAIATSCVAPPPMILAVNKIDLSDRAPRDIDRIQAEHAPKFAALFFVSALTGESVDDLFEACAFHASKFVPEPTALQLRHARDQPKPSGCC
jgi:small GTP-binding protein